VLLSSLSGGGLVLQLGKKVLVMLKLGSLP
jgi:hypothetical protein